MRKLAATAIALIVSIPLIPLVEKKVGHVTGVDAPMVFPAQGWTLMHELMHAAVILPPNERRATLVGNALLGRALSRDTDWKQLLISLEDSKRAGEFEIAFSGHGVPSDSADFSAFPSVGLSLNNVGRFRDHSALYDNHLIQDPVHRGQAEPATLPSGGNTAPIISSIAPTATVAQGQALTLTINGSNFESGATVLWATSSAVDSYEVYVSDSVESSRRVNPVHLACDSGERCAAVTGAQLRDLAVNGRNIHDLAKLIPGVAQPGGANDQSSLSAIGSYSINGTRVTMKDMSIDGSSVTRTDQRAPQVTVELQRIDKTGWYSLAVVGHSVGRGLINAEFVPDSGGEHQHFALKESEGGGAQAAWIRFKEPGSLIVRATDAVPALRGMGYAEFISRSRDITLSKAVLTVFLLEELIPLTAWLVIVCLIRALSYKIIRWLPRKPREHAQHEVDLMLSFAKWVGVGCYVIWTAKDILAGVGIGVAG